MSQTNSETALNSSPKIVRLGEHYFTSSDNVLKNEADELVPLRSQTTDVLKCLVENAGSLVTKESLYETVWADSVVTDDSLVQCISEIRKVLGDKDHAIVKTLPRKGYMIVAESIDNSMSNEVDVPIKTKSGKSRYGFGIAACLVAVLGIFALAKMVTSSSDGLAHKTDIPRIAVLPFDDFSVGSDKGYFSDAIAEGLITEMARYRKFEVIAKNSSFKYRDTPTDARKIGHELGVHYILEGSQQKIGDKLNVSVRLINAQRESNIWTHTYKMEVGDLFIVQDKIINTVANRVGSHLEKPAPGSDPEAVSALHFHLKGVEAIRSDFNVESNEKLMHYSKLAIEADPTAHYGYLGLAFAYRHAATFSWHGLEKKEAQALGFENARKALNIEPNDADVHYSLARLHADAGQDKEARLNFDKAIQLNPSASSYLVASTTPMLYVGETDKAIDRIKQAMGIDPFHPDWYHWHLSWALWERDDCAGALASIKRMKKITKGAHRMLSGIHACLGDEEEAKKAYKVFYTDSAEPTISEQREQWEEIWTAEGSLERWLVHMKIAGMKE